MSPLSLIAAADPAATQPSIGTPTLWAITIGAIALLFVADFLITRRPHEVSMREAVGWSAFYVAIPLGFGVWIWQQYGGDRGLEYYTGYLVEKSLSVDNLFVFLLLLTAFAVPRELQQRVLLIGVAGALVLRGVFIALGAQLIASFSWAFLLFGAVLLVTAVKVGRDALSPQEHTVDIGSIRIVRVLRRLWPVTESYAGTRMTVRETGAGRSPRWRSSPWPSSAPTWSSRSTRCRPSTASPATRTSSSRPTPSPCSACGRSTSSSRAPWVAAPPRPRPGRDPRLHRRQAGAALGARRLAGRAGGAHPRLARVIVGILALATTTSMLANRRDARGAQPRSVTCVDLTTRPRHPRRRRRATTGDPLVGGHPASLGWNHDRNPPAAAHRRQQRVHRGGVRPGRPGDPVGPGRRRPGALRQHRPPARAGPSIRAGVPVCWPWFGPGRAPGWSPRTGSRARPRGTSSR